MTTGKLRFYCTGLLLACLCLHSAAPPCEASKVYNRYLAHLFQKYGSGGTMTFEGLEHLMFNLGLGQIEFNPQHTIDEHRPKGFNNQQPENETVLQEYFNQESSKLLPNEADRKENTFENEQNKKQPRQSTVINLATQTTAVDTDDDTDVDVVVKERNVLEKGNVLEFKEMHDPKHRHPRDNDATFDGPPLTANVCLSPKSLLRLIVDHDDLHKRKFYKTFPVATSLQSDGHNSEAEYNEFVNNVKLTPVAFMKLCPALLAQIDQHVCARSAPLTNGETVKESMWNAWIYATGTISVLSACGLLGVILVPLAKTVAYQEILQFLIAVAVGTLTGDALMHLLPHALQTAQSSTEHVGESAHGHDNKAVWICACAFATALLMYILEHLLPFVTGKRSDHGHSHGQKDKHATETNTHGRHEHNTQPPSSATVDPTPREINIMLDEHKQDMKKPRPLTSLAFMVVVGDGLHNLTDGLAIGAAFATDPVTGFATAFAVLCHELPHELGDFALLLQTGLSMKRAIVLNIVSSVLSFLGMTVGLLVASSHAGMTQWIYSGTAGSFLYIALANLVPSMSAGESRQEVKVILIQLLGMLTGGLIMLAIAVNEDKLEILFK